MKNIPLYENLETSFVNLSALIRYLRARCFAGQLIVSLRGYEAQITFDRDDRINIQEHDRIAGRIAEGEEALQRLLIRAREPGGIINVYQFAEIPEIAELPIPKIPKPETPPIVEKPSARPVRREVPEFALASNGNGRTHEKLPPLELPIPTPPPPGPLPLEFTNRVEERARQMQMSEEGWQILTNVIGELLGTVDKTMADAGLNFPVAFAKARAEISEDYPFLSPESNVFSYLGGRVRMAKKINAKLFAASINESLRRILDLLASEQRFEEVYRDVTHKILSLIHRNKLLYNDFFITPQLERIVGV